MEADLTSRLQTAFRISGDEGATVFCTSHTKGKTPPKTWLSSWIEGQPSTCNQEAAEETEKALVRLALAFGQLCEKLDQLMPHLVAPMWTFYFDLKSSGRDKRTPS
jgi:hypothetical protein